MALFGGLKMSNVITKEGDSVLAQASTKVEITSPMKVFGHPRSYKIVGNDIYTIKRNNDPDEWFLDLIHDAMDTSDLATDLNDLTNLFNNFEDGVTKEIGYIQDGQDATAYDLSVVKASNDTNTAGIQRLDVAKVTPEQASAVARTTIAAWQNDGDGGAWFDQKVSTVANVAYSTAKSISTLSATMQSQQEQLTNAYGDIATLQKQTDGKVITWFGTVRPTSGLDPISGPIDETVKPYFCWLDGNLCPEAKYDDVLSTDTRIEHTSDVYVWYELETDGVTKKILATYRFGYDQDSDTYSWNVFSDDLATEAYVASLAAQSTADSKVSSFLQDYPPYIEVPSTSDTTVINTNDKLIGDLWYDSDYSYTYDFNGTDITIPADNTLFIYTKTEVSPGIYSYTWQTTLNEALKASVKTISEATVTVGGIAKARGGLLLEAGDAVAGFVVAADDSTTGSPSSSFKVIADKFEVANGTNTYSKPPFSIDTTANDIRFNGIVSFDNVDGDTDFVEFEDLSTPTTQTVINGANIRTGYMAADRISTSTAWVDGWLKSSNYSWNGSISSNVTGFGLFSTGTELGSYGYNIVGGKIYGSELVSAKLTTADLVVKSEAGYNCNIQTEYSSSSTTYSNSTSRTRSSIIYLGVVSYNNSSSSYNDVRLSRNNNCSYRITPVNPYLLELVATSGTGSGTDLIGTGGMIIRLKFDLYCNSLLIESSNWVTNGSYYTSDSIRFGTSGSHRFSRGFNVTYDGYVETKLASDGSGDSVATHDAIRINLVNDTLLKSMNSSAGLWSLTVYWDFLGQSSTATRSAYFATASNLL